MTANNFNIGSDAKVTWLSDGAVVGASILTKFSKKQRTKDIESEGIDGVNRFRNVEAGWEGTAMYDRTDSRIDDYFALKETARYAGLPPPVVTFSESIVNASDGATARYRYDGVTMTLENAGDIGGDSKIEQSISWKASRRIKVA